MENFLPSVLGISAEWNKHKLIYIFCLLFLSASLVAQEKETKTPISGKELANFNELFFEAEKELQLGNFSKAFEKFLKLYKIDSENATVCYHLGELYSRQNSANEAVFYAEKSVELDGKNKWFKIGLAAVYRKFELSEKQISVFQDLVELEPKNPDFNYELAIAYANNDEFKKALAQLNKLEEIIGVNEIVTEQKKQIHLVQGNVEAAVEESRNLIEAFPKEMKFRSSLGELFMSNNLFEEALEVFEEMLKIAPENPRAQLNLAEYYRKTGDKTKSLDFLKLAIANPDLGIDQKIPTLLSLFSASERDTALRNEAYKMLADVIKTNPDDPKAYAIYGDFLSRDGLNLEALAAYKKAVSLENGGKFQIWEQILIIEIQTEQYDSLMVDGQKAIDLFPNQPIPYFFTGIAFINEDEILDGIDFLEEGLNYVFSNPRLKEQYYSQLADAYHRLEEHSKSDAYFEKALGINSQNPSTLNNFAYYLSERNQSLDRALEMSKKSNLLSPNNPTFLDTWAWILYQKGEYSLALKKMEEVIRLSSSPNGEIYDHYGDILSKNGNADLAIIQYQKAKNLGYKISNMEEKIKLLNNP